MKPTLNSSSPSPSAAAPNPDRESLIWKAHQVFRQRGYHGTTMADIGAACGMLKGSIYYHFASKEALMIEVLRTAHQVFAQKVFELAYHEHLSPTQRLQAMLEITETFYYAKEGGCLMANVALEAGDRMEAFAQIVRQFFQDWLAAFTHLFLTRYDEPQARQLATAALQDIQGALIFSCIYTNESFFAPTRERILSQLD